MWIKKLSQLVLGLIRFLLRFLTLPYHLVRLTLRVDKMEKQLEDVQELTLDTIESIPDEGWSSTIHNAIMNLDNRMDTLRLVVQQHQQNFTVIATERRELEELATQPKDNLN